MRVKSISQLLISVFILVILIVLLFLSFQYYSEDNVESDLDFSESSFTVLLKEGEDFEKSIQVANLGSSTESVSVVIDNLDGFVFLDETSFNLRPGEIKILDILFDSGSETFSFQPGVYVGSLKFNEEAIPVVVEIESTDVLFDMNLDFEDDVVYVSVYDFADFGGVSVDMEYEINNINGAKLFSESEELFVNTQSLRNVDVFGDYGAGTYVFFTIVEYGDSVGTASYIFDVEEDLSYFYGVLLILTLSIIVVLIFIVYLFVSPKSKVVKKKVKKKGFFARWRAKTKKRKLERGRKRKAELRKKELEKKKEEALEKKKLKKQEAKQKKEAAKQNKLSKKKEDAYVPEFAKHKEKKKSKLSVLKTVKNPHRKMKQLIKDCRSFLEKKNSNMAESFFEQTKPVYAKFNEEDRRKYYQELVDLQNKLVMLKMSDFRKTLIPKKKTK